MRAEGAVVIGRKGSGKSAIYLQIVESFPRIGGPASSICVLRRTI